MNIEYRAVKSGHDVLLDGTKVGFIRAPFGTLASSSRYQAEVTPPGGEPQHRRFADAAWAEDLARAWVESRLEEALEPSNRDSGA